MSAPQVAKISKRPEGDAIGVPCPILPATVEKFWPSIEQLLVHVERWTKLVSASDIRQGIAKGAMQLWAVRTRADHVPLAVTTIVSTGSGLICRLWLIASHLNEDDRSISALIDLCETDARMRGCSALEIIAYPAWVERIAGRHTGIIIERDFKAQGTH
jgi:hypothetical protein